MIKHILTLVWNKKRNNVLMALEVAREARQIHGGMGFVEETGAAQHYRDARITTIYEGTSQLQVVAATGPLLGGALDDLLADEAGVARICNDLTAALKKASMPPPGGGRGIVRRRGFPV